MGVLKEKKDTTRKMFIERMAESPRCVNGQRSTNAPHRACAVVATPDDPIMTLTDCLQHLRKDLDKPWLLPHVCAAKMTNRECETGENKCKASQILMNRYEVE